MTDTTPDPEIPTLSPFEGSAVVAAKIEIPDAAGGLRDAMAISPVELHHGDEGLIVLRYRVKKVRFDPADKDDESGELVRVHVFKTLEAMFFEDSELEERVRSNALSVKLAVEKLAGKLSLLDDAEPDEDDTERAAELVKAHDMGLHPHVLVEGCSACAQRAADRADDKPGGGA